MSHATGRSSDDLAVAFAALVTGAVCEGLYTPERSDASAGGRYVSSLPAPSARQSIAIREANLSGLHVIVSSPKDQLDATALSTVELGGGMTGIVVQASRGGGSSSQVEDAVRQLAAADLSPNEAAMGILEILDRHEHPSAALVAMWQPAGNVLTFIAAALEPPVIINAGWPHQAGESLIRQTIRGPQKVAFGVRRLSQGERWLLHSGALVEVADPHVQSFNSVGLVQYAHDERAMPYVQWVDYLVSRGLKAHRGSLPHGSLLISLRCDKAPDVKREGDPVG